MNQSIIQSEQSPKEPLLHFPKWNSYYGGDVKGFFRSLCINLKLNERRITKPDLPGESHHLDKHDHSMEIQMVKKSLRF